MTTLTKPQARIPVGWVTVAGQRLPVVIDLEWDRYLSTVTERAGGVIGDSTTDLAVSAFDDAGTEELEALLYSTADAWMQCPSVPADIANEQALMLPICEPAQPETELLADLAALRAEVDTLRQAVQGLAQGSLI